MGKKIVRPTVVEAAGNKPKIIEEYIGAVNSGNADLSIARMISPAGWEEPGQRPAFAEYTVVLKGVLQVRTDEETFKIQAGQAFIAPVGQWVQYSTPTEDGAEYIAVCRPAFTPQTVHRDE